MNNWKPITDSEFNNLFQSQYAELDSTQKNKFNRFRVPFWKARIRRGKSNTHEFVFVVAQNTNGVLYFDDVEYGFNISMVDPDGRITTPGGSQNTSKESIDEWFKGAV
jgi:hypothetical protein